MIDLTHTSLGLNSVRRTDPPGRPSAPVGQTAVYQSAPERPFKQMVYMDAERNAPRVSLQEGACGIHGFTDM